MTANVAYLDCSAGISGELLLAALLDVGFSLDVLNDTLTILPIQGYQLKHTPVQQNGMHGSTLVIIPPSESGVSVRSLADSIAMIQTAALPVRIREISLAILRRLEEACSVVSGSPASEVLCTEFEALKAMICVVGVVAGIESLAITQLYASPLPLSVGLVGNAQGLQPVVLEMLRHVGAFWRPSLLEGKLVTVVGAALLAALALFERPTIAIAQVGYAFDRAPLPSGECCFCLYIGRLQTALRSENERVDDADADWVAVIESHVDTMTGELLGGLMERLLTLGALDVSYTPLQMKKNRPASLVTVICPLEQGEQFALTLLRETSTLGVRIQQVRRLKAQREQKRIDTPFGEMIVKVKRLGAQVISIAPEYEECRRIANARNIPLADVYDGVRQAIQSAIISGKKENATEGIS
jgi:hypothetical protein